jgi:dihydropyrimidine dehydrogenase (NAD+) subunit PreA
VIALHLVQQMASDPEVGLPISGIGGIMGWREAAEFILLQLRNGAGVHGSHALQLRTVRHGRWAGCDGREKGFRTIGDFCGLSVPKIRNETSRLNYRIVARIDRDKCIGRPLLYRLLTAHQCIHLTATGAGNREAAGGRTSRNADRQAGCRRRRPARLHRGGFRNGGGTVGCNLAGWSVG